MWCRHQDFSHLWIPLQSEETPVTVYRKHQAVSVYFRMRIRIIEGREIFTICITGRVTSKWRCCVWQHFLNALARIYFIYYLSCMFIEKTSKILDRFFNHSEHFLIRSSIHSFSILIASEASVSSLNLLNFQNMEEL